MNILNPDHLSTSTSANGKGPDLSTLWGPDNLPAPMQESVVVRLDTGRVVEMVIGELSMFYELGEIPDELTPIAQRILFTSAKEDAREIEKRYYERLKIAKWTASKVLRNNRVPLDRFYHDEFFQIYDLANNPGKAMDNFRQQQAQHVGLVQVLQDVGTDAEPAVASATAAE